MAQTFGNIGLQGSSVGTFALKQNGLEWRDRNNVATEWASADVKKLSWNMYGSRGYLKVEMVSGDWTRMDGFARSDFDILNDFAAKNYKMVIAKEEVSSEGASFGNLSLKDNTLVMTSIVNNNTMFELKLENASQCVVPKMAANDLELQFGETTTEKEEETITSITFHFPAPEVDDQGFAEEVTPAMSFQEEIMKTGVIKSIKGDVICEFSKEVGSFVSPRGKYGIQLTSTFMHMIGTQYTYKIKYSDITSLFLLDRPDGLRVALVICLSLPIRQGAQKYQYLVLETHKMEHTIALNLTDEEIEANDSYRGNLQPEMTMALSSCIAKLFKVLTETPVYVPKTFKSFRDDFCFRCSHKTQDGLLYPLAKSMIFINKPTVVLTYDEIEQVEFQRYLPSANSATKNFDLLITVKRDANFAAGGKEISYQFTSIDRSEYNYIFDYFESKKLNIINPQKGLPEGGAHLKGAFAGMDGGGDDDDESDESDYKAGESDKSGDSDDSGTDESDEEGGEEGRPKKDKAARAPKEKRAKAEKGSPKKKAPAKSKGERKEKKKKDPNAPKKALSAYMFFMASERPVISAEQETSGEKMKPTEVATELGRRWKLLDAEAKAPFDEQARADKDRYSEAIKEYNAKRAAEGADLESDDDMGMDMGGGSDDE